MGTQLKRIPVSPHPRSIVSCLSEETFQKLLDMHQDSPQNHRMREALLTRSN